MIDVDTLIEAANPVPPGTLPSADAPAARRLYLEILARPVSPPRRAGRIARPAAIAGIAAVVAVVLALVVFGGSGAPGPNPGASSELTAAEFFRHAGKAALTEATTVPQADQYVYSETESGTGGTIKTWLPTNGTRPGAETIAEPGTKIALSTSASQIPACTVAQAETSACVLPSAGYYPHLPTQSDQILGYLATIHVVPSDAPASEPEPTWEDNDLAKMMDWLFMQSYVTPAQQAAIYNLMAQTPGFSVVPGVTDALGRSGVGIEWKYEGGYGELIFSPTTYAFLGMRTWPEDQPPTSSSPYDGSALVKVAIVNQIGQTP